MATPAKICYLCKRNDDDPLEVGEWKSIENVHVHHFCVLLSKCLAQHGRDDEGVSGFLWPDIEACARITKRNICYYCKESAASVWCDDRSCNRSYHVACGMQNGCLFKFRGAYESFCEQHHGITDTKHYIHADVESCFICLEPLGNYNPVTSIPSCCDKGWFHRDCMKKSANAAGLMLHCPLCGEDKAGYQKFVTERGVFVPHQYAAWEKSAKASKSKSKLFRHKATSPYHRCQKTCEMQPCECPHGRRSNKGPWKLLVCQYCGSNGAHRKCLPSGRKTHDYVCVTCTGQSPPRVEEPNRLIDIPLRVKKSTATSAD